jgi:hypothetical protein
MNIVLFNIEYLYIQLYYWSKMFVIVYVVNLCNVFHDVKLLLQILVGAK